MKVLRLHKPFDLRFHDEPIPDIGPDEVLVQVQSVGVCASDVHYYREGRIGDQIVEKPIVLGHEFSGTIANVGTNVMTHAVGDRVAVEPTNPCHACAVCKEGWFHICPNVKFFGTPPIDGALREFLAWPAELCIQVGDGVSFDEAAMVEPLGVGVHAVDLAELAGAESVAVLGAGAIGLSVLQAAKIACAGKIIVSEPIPERRKLALKLGADVVIDPITTDSCADIMKLTDGGAEVVFECAGMLDTVRQTVAVVRPRGRIIIVGIPEEDEYTLPASLARRREVNVQFVRRSLNTAERCVELIERKLVDVASCATHAFPFDKAEDAIKLAMDKTDGVLRAMIHVHSD